MGRVFRFLLLLIFVGILVFLGYTLVTDPSAPAERVVVPVTPNLN